jgi:hypothetical protein
MCLVFCLASPDNVVFSKPWVHQEFLPELPQSCLAHQTSHGDDWQIKVTRRKQKKHHLKSFEAVGLLALGLFDVFVTPT